MAASRSFFHLSVGALRFEIADADHVAEFRLQIVGSPGVQGNLALAEGSNRLAFAVDERAQRR